MLLCDFYSIQLGSGSAPDPLAGFKGPTSKGREEGREGKAKEKGEVGKWKGGGKGGKNHTGTFFLQFELCGLEICVPGIYSSPTGVGH